MNQAKALQVQQEVQLRFLCPADVGEVKKLCTEWFPIEYPDSWYDDITSSSRFYSLAATHQSRIVGLIVAELKAKSKLNKEDGDILASYYPSSMQVAYILSLGVVDDFRRNGIASLLLDSLLSYLTSKEASGCKAVYLHVLATNTVAIRFYERRNFRPHSFLPFYYSIQGKPRDGYSYVLYINGGQPPWSFIDYIAHCGSLISKLQPCGLPRQLYRAVRNMVQRFLSRPPVEVSHSS
ncbi:N-alpha-acetyltransferase 60-like [Pomacea canaliculata]|uniref:N-alpha-acetyltransferase 60-like n=1 Tax=Pomacea canaliculata TaxID=400727 RepID=UPI000D73C775|nr:N-alpha-acetyltransferase 60-like [Pomacea canaliculata]XP_025099391.1 N-alpha-acetyltransferase 60-like [Pomacea canaliculata]XP_025099401.1 N-alpha-acetyltransferase 60-like [Pomacea canaliculata]